MKLCSWLVVSGDSSDTVNPGQAVMRQNSYQVTAPSSSGCLGSREEELSCLVQTGCVSTQSWFRWPHSYQTAVAGGVLSCSPVDAINSGAQPSRGGGDWASLANIGPSTVSLAGQLEALQISKLSNITVTTTNPTPSPHSINFGLPRVRFNTSSWHVLNYWMALIQWSCYILF